MSRTTSQPLRASQRPSDAAADLQRGAPRAAPCAGARRWSGSAASLLAVVVLGGWQLFTAAGIVDPFFFGQPRGIWHQLVELFTARHRVRLASGCRPLGHAQGGAARLPARHGRRRRPRRRCSARTATSPTSSARTSRSSTRSRASCSARSSSSRSASACSRRSLLAAVLVFFVVFFNAFQGVREVDRTSSPTSGCSGASPLQVARHVDHALGADLDHRQPAHRLRLRHHRRARRRGARRPEGHRPDHQPRRRATSTRTASSPRWSIIAVVALGAECLITPARAPRCWPGARRAAPRPPGHLTPADRYPPSSPITRHQRKESHHEQAQTIAAVAAVAQRSRRSAPAGGRLRQRRAPRSSGRRRRLPTVKMMVGGIDKQIYLPYQLAQSLGFYKKYGVNVELSHRAERRRRRRGRHGLGPGRHGRRLVHPHHRLPVEGQGRHRRRPALRRARRARDVRHRAAASTRPPTSRARPSASPTSARAPTS